MEVIDRASAGIAAVEGRLGKLRAALDRVNSSIEEVQEVMSRWEAVEGVLKRVSLATGGLIAAIGGIVVQGVRTQAHFEQLAKRLEVILGPEKGRKMFEWAVEFAAKTPYEVGEVVDATTALAVVAEKAGVDLTKLVERVGDIAAASGQSIFDIALAVGRAVGGETRSIKELTRGMISVSLEGLEDIENKAPAVVQQIMEQSAKYQGMMSKMAETTALKWSNLKDAISRMWWALGEAFAPTAKKIIEWLTHIIEGIGKWVKTHSSLVYWLTVITAIGGGMIFLASTIGIVIIFIAKLITSLNILAASWGRVATAAGAAAAAQGAAAGVGGGAGVAAGAGAGVLGRIAPALGGVAGTLGWAGLFLLLAGGAAYLGHYLGTRHHLAPWTRAQRETSAWQEALQAMTPEERAYRIWGKRTMATTPAINPVVVYGDILPYNYQDEQQLRELQRQMGYGGW